MRALTCGSRLRSVTGNTGSALSSMMPKRAENLASGGVPAVRTLSGNLSAFNSGRPASSLMPPGISSRNSAFSGNGPLKVTSPFSAYSGAPSRSGRRGPSARTSPCVWRVERGVEPQGHRQHGDAACARVFALAGKFGQEEARVSKCRTWSWPVATPESDWMPSPPHQADPGLHGQPLAALQRAGSAGPARAAAASAGTRAAARAPRPRRCAAPMRSLSPGDDEAGVGEHRGLVRRGVEGSG